MDQTPLAFDFIGSRTYESKGAKTVFQKESRSGQDKRQCILQVTAYGDGVQRCRPLIIFHGAEKGDSRRVAEVRRYYPEVKVLWNPKAWANEKTMLQWVRKNQKLSLPYSSLNYSSKAEPQLIALDAFKAHLTPTVYTELKKQRTTLLAISGGCTGFVQPLDVSINKPLKDLIKEEQDAYQDKHINEYEQEKYNISER